MSLRFRYGLPALLIVLIIYGVGTAYAQQMPHSYARLAELCRVWGEIKVFNPLVAEQPGLWDSALMSAIPKVRIASTVDELHAAYNGMFRALGDANTGELGKFIVDGSVSPHSKLLGSDSNWIKFRDATALISANLKVYSKDIQPQRPIVIDLRWQATTIESEAIENALWRFVREFVPERSLRLPPVRRVVYNGYLPQTEGGSQIYSKTYEYIPTRSVEGKGTFTLQLPIIFVVNQQSIGVSRILQTLQRASLAIVIAEGAMPMEAGIRVATRTLSTGLEYRFRVSENAYPEGSVGFMPDTVMTSVPSDVAMLAAVRPRTPERAMDYPPYKELAYESLDTLSAEFRLLALFRLWTVGKYFYAYQDLLDTPWDSVLVRMIPKYLAATNSEQFSQALLSTNARFQDGHVSASHPSFTRLIGERALPVMGRVIGGRLIITEIDSAILPSGQVDLGDEILLIDGITLDSFRRVYAPVISFSTPQELDVKLLSRLFRTNEVTKVFTIRKQSGETADVRIQSFDQLAPNEPPMSSAFKVVDSVADIHYVNLMTLTSNQVRSTFEQFRNSSAVIFDLRGYPEPTIWRLAPMLATRQSLVCRFGNLRLSDPDSVRWSWTESKYFIKPETNGGYKGKIVVLINDNAISRSEHTALFLKALGAKFVGSKSRGTNGDVTNTILPGGYWVSFTGLNVKHADGSELQRRGIIPDIHVEPTPEDIRLNRDAVLEKALEYLRN